MNITVRKTSCIKGEGGQSITVCSKILEQSRRPTLTFQEINCFAMNRCPVKMGNFDLSRRGEESKWSHY